MYLGIDESLNKVHPKLYAVLINFFQGKFGSVISWKTVIHSGISITATTMSLIQDTTSSVSTLSRGVAPPSRTYYYAKQGGFILCIFLTLKKGERHANDTLKEFTVNIENHAYLCAYRIVKIFLKSCFAVRNMTMSDKFMCC